MKKKCFEVIVNVYAHNEQEATVIVRDAMLGRGATWSVSAKDTKESDVNIMDNLIKLTRLTGVKQDD